MPYTSFHSEIRQAYDKLRITLAAVPIVKRNLKLIDGTAGKISLTDLIAYQIGWGKCLIRWYESGLHSKVPEMPGEGFSQWKYAEIAQHFYEKYRFDAGEEQLKILDELVLNIVEIAKQEETSGNLERIGVWSWCTLRSGKLWPLRKWIQVNTVAPYNQAVKMINKTFP